MTTIFGAQGVSPTLRGQPTNIYNLQPSETMLIPAGTWDAQVDGYCSIQQYDPIQTCWRSIGGGTGIGLSPDHFRYVNSDGVNYRIANQTGCVVGALLTNKGSGYTSLPTVTDNGGGSPTYLPILGPVVNTVVTVNTGGTNYTYPPLVQISAPAAPGVQATGWATITNGAVTAITITDQGANYTSNPTISLINDPRDSTGSGATATLTTTGAGTIAAILVTNHGSTITSSTVLPTITISGGGGSSGAATPIMCTTITGYTITSTGSGYVGTVEVSALGGFPSTAPAYTNPKIQANLVRTRKASILAAISGGQLSSTGSTVFDGGIYSGMSPTQIIYGLAVGAGTLAVGNVAFTFGGVASTTALYAV